MHIYIYIYVYLYNCIYIYIYMLYKHNKHMHISTYPHSRRSSKHIACTIHEVCACVLTCCVCAPAVRVPTRGHYRSSAQSMDISASASVISAAWVVVILYVFLLSIISLLVWFGLLVSAMSAAWFRGNEFKGVSTQRVDYLSHVQAFLSRGGLSQVTAIFVLLNMFVLNHI